MTDFEKESIIVSDALRGRVDETQFLDKISKNAGVCTASIFEGSSSISGYVKSFMHDRGVFKIDIGFRKEQLRNFITKFDKLVLTFFDEQKEFEIREPSVKFSMLGEEVVLSMIFLET